MAKLKQWIYAKKTKVFYTKNLNSQSGAFFTSNARTAFTKLRQMFVKTPILNHFDSDHHIQIETDVLGYAIGVILS